MLTFKFPSSSRSEVKPFRRAPKLDIAEIATDLMSLLGLMADSDCDELDVRIQYHNGSLTMHWGDPSFDTDHRGSWGYSVLYSDMNQKDVYDVASELIQDLLGNFYSNFA